MKNKKFIFLGVIAILILGAIFYFKDNTDVNKVEKETNESAEASAKKQIEKLNNDAFGDDIDFDDIEEAPLALDTTKAEK
jgi:predicted RND superfamily exporter protein